MTSRIAFGAGYLLGSRAGREWYDEMVGRVREFVGSLVVDKLVDRAVGYLEQQSSSGPQGPR